MKISIFSVFELIGMIAIATGKHIIKFQSASAQLRLFDPRLDLIQFPIRTEPVIRIPCSQSTDLSFYTFLCTQKLFQ